MALSSPGVGSGLDVNGIVTQLMTLERQPMTALDNREAQYQAQLSAYGSLKGALSSFQAAVSALATPAKFSSIRANVADSSVASASASSSAAAGTYAVEVQALAAAQKLKSEPLLSTGAELGSGKLTISFGTYSADTFTLNPEKATREISITAAQNSLAGVRDAINAADAGVTAAIVNDGTGYRLTISSKDSGVANALRIAVHDDDATDTDASGLSQLMYDARTISGTKRLTETVEAKNAAFTLDGIAISKASNTVTDAIEGVTLNLLKATTPSASTLTTLTVSRDTAGVQSAVQSFVKAYNDLNKTVTDLSKYDAVNRKASTLTGESTVRSLQSQLRNVFNARLAGAGGGLTSLSDVGIAFQTDGTLKLDTAKLSTVLADTAKDVSTLFAAVGKPTDSLVSFASSTADTKNGAYALSVSQLAAQGKAVGGSAAALTIVADGNDTLDLSIDGVSASVTLSAGTYSASSLAAELQAKINGVTALSAAGSAVMVSQSSGTLTVTSNRYGSASSVTMIGGSALSDLFGTQTETAGIDVAGSMGGNAATGSGQTLTGAGDATGLAVKVTGGSAGTRGSIGYARGYAYELDKLVGRMLETDSLVDGRMDGINASIKEIGTQREAMNRRLASIEQRYRKQFTALDGVMSNMSRTSSFLQQQLANLNASSK